MIRKWKIKNGASLVEEVEEIKEEEVEEVDMCEEAVERRTRSNSTVEDDLLHNDNYYQLLELGHVMRPVTVAEVTAGYKKAAIKYHPDKKRRGRNAEDVRQLWLKVQRAFETLQDTKGKQRYDSSLPFDDSIPTAKECVDDETYFKLWDATFRRNSQYSNKLPYLDPVDKTYKCPLIGDNDSDMNHVNAFYKFWTNMDSWRCFDHFAKNTFQQIKQAGDRHQKRRMEKENQVEIKQHASEEHKRMINLVETARKLDPRIKRGEAAALEVKMAAKNAATEKKNAEKALLNAGKNAAKKAEEDAKAAKDAVDNAARALVQEENKALNAQFKSLKALCEGKMKGSKVFDKYWVDGSCKRDFRKAIFAKMLVAQLERLALGETAALEEQFKAIVTDVTARSVDAAGNHEEALAKMCEGPIVEIPVVEVKEEAKSNAPTQAQAQAAEGWTDANLTKLAAQMVAIPAGTAQRSKKIATAMGMPQKEVDKKVTALDKKAKADKKKK